LCTSAKQHDYLAHSKHNICHFSALTKYVARNNWCGVEAHGSRGEGGGHFSKVRKHTSNRNWSQNRFPTIKLLKVLVGTLVANHFREIVAPTLNYFQQVDNELFLRFVQLKFAGMENLLVIQRVRDLFTFSSRSV
jgi:hypothetical protein